MNLRSFTDSPEGLFDWCPNVMNALFTPGEIGLRPCEAVCSGCNLAYNSHLGACPEGC